MIQYRFAGRTSRDIGQSIEEGIQTGRIAPGDLLPPVRDLAASLNVSPATVSSAYRLLHSRGLLMADRRRGTRVRPLGDVPARTALSRHESQVTADLSSGNPDPALLPGLSSALRSIPVEPTLYGASAELRSLVAFAKGEFSADGIDVGSVLVVGGALDAIDRILREHLRPGDRVVVEDPGLPALFDLLTASGFKAEPVAMDVEGPTAGALDTALGRRPAAVIVTPRAQNPTGAAITTRRAAELRAVLKRHPAPLVIESDPLGPIAGVPALTLTAGRTRWAIVRSTSKFLGPDLRVALLAGDDLTLSRVRTRQALGTRWVSHLLQHAALALWSDPSSGRHLARVTETYAHRRNALVRALATEGLDVAAASGFNIWIPVRHEAAVVDALAQRGWGVAAGERFRLRADPGIRVTTSALAPADAQRFAAALGSIVRAAAPVLA